MSIEGADPQKIKKKEADLPKNDTPVIDFTDAQEFGALPAGKYIFSIAKWEYTKSSKGNPAVKLEAVVVRPDNVKGRVFDTINAENEWTKARIMNILAATGEFGSKEDIKAQKKFVAPPSTEMVGLQFAAQTKVVDPPEGREDLTPQAQLVRIFSVEEYEREVEAGAASI